MVTNAHRRGAGEGNIRKRSTGVTTRWEGRLDTGQVTTAGKRDVRSVYGATRTEVQRKLAALRRDLEAGRAAADVRTVAGYLTAWLDGKASSLRAKTNESYGYLVRGHIVPALGTLGLTDVTPAHVRTLYAAKPASLAHHIHSVLHAALADAVKHELVTRNVAALVDVPRIPKREYITPTASDLRRLFDATRNDRLYPLWLLMVYASARPGELFALRWSDVDLDRGTLSIQRSLEDVRHGAPVTGDTKRVRSKRTLTLPPVAVAALRTWRQRQASERAALPVLVPDYDLVFTTTTGIAHNRQTVGRSFKLALCKAGLPRETRVYDLRHASATLMLAAGVPLKVASERLGHSGIGITADLYTHRVASLEADAATRIAALLSPEVPDR